MNLASPRLPQSAGMLQQVIQQLREAGWRKVLVLIVALAVSVVLAFGFNKTDNYADPHVKTTTVKTTAAKTTHPGSTKTR